MAAIVVLWPSNAYAQATLGVGSVTFCTVDFGGAVFDSLYCVPPLQVDEICEEHEVEKIKTIGDCYMCVAFTEDGVEAQRRALGRVLAVADAMHDIAARTLLEGEPMSVRVGVHTGLVLTGIIGKTKFAFDLSAGQECCRM